VLPVNIFCHKRGRKGRDPHGEGEAPLPFSRENRTRACAGIARREEQLSRGGTATPRVVPNKKSCLRRRGSMQVIKARQIAAEEEPSSRRISALSMYSVPPTERISHTEFEDFALDRLRCAHATEGWHTPRCPPQSSQSVSPLPLSSLSCCSAHNH
jgi:hypothetical protein